jgi:hypothetical protein
MVQTINLAAVQMPLLAQPLHHRQHGRARESTRQAEPLDGLRDGRRAALADELQERQFLVADALRGRVTTHVVSVIVGRDDTCSQEALRAPERSALHSSP